MCVRNIYNVQRFPFNYCQLSFAMVFILKKLSPKRIACTQIFNVRCTHEKINADT